MRASVNKIGRGSRDGRAVLRTFGCILLSVALLQGDLVRADEFLVTLQVRQGKRQVLATSQLPVIKQTKAKPGKIKIIKSRPRLNKRKKPPSRPRPVLQIPVKQTVLVRWRIAKSKSPAKFKDVLVHIFAVKETMPGQQTVPKLSDKIAYESALTMDFTPKDQASGQFQLRFERPGSYLVRVETIGLTGKLGHEFHAAIDVVVNRTAKTKRK